jgi:high-affinity Fe2+/Pb2+ permease
MYLKMIFILVTYIVYFAALLLIGVLIVFSRTNNNTLGNLVSAANLNLFNMSK